tara:strand:- start:5900 stop:6538 length:639 start_codon:yes stop_codon:yes gene_type:complete
MKHLIKIIFKIAILKSIYYSIKFGGVIVIGKRCKINISKGGKIVFKSKKSSLYLGIYFSIYGGATLDIYKNGTLIVGKSVGIHRGTKVVVQKSALLDIGDRTFINENSRVQCLKSIKIGKECSIAWNCTIIDSDLHGIFINNILSNPNSEIIIEDKVWVCSNTTITKGAYIEKNCIVGANSVVVKNKLKSNRIYSGSPIKEIKEFERWGQLN